MKKTFPVLVAIVLSLIVGAGAVLAFSDVTVNHPNYKAITDLKNRGVINGYPDGTFRPDQAVNRVEALKIILNAAKIDAATAKTRADFSDTDLSQWYAAFLNKAVELKIVAGYPDHTFKPLQTVNLAENLKMLLNAEGTDVSGGQVAADPFADVSKEDWFAKFVQYAKDKKLVEADSLNRVFPAQGMTRAKLAELAYRLILIKENALDFYGQVKQDTPGQVPVGVPQNDNSLQVNIKDMSFNLASMTIAQGTTVRWTNLDSALHNVSSDTGLFVSPDLSSGGSWTYTFNDLGTFNYHCSFHPAMKGSIVVKPSYMVPTI